MRPTPLLLSLARNIHTNTHAPTTPASAPTTHTTAAAADIATRTVHIKSYPSARTLAERREVLRVLEGFGEVVMFRCLKHHPLEPVPNAFFGIFASAASVKEIVNASPIRYQLTSSPVTSAPNPPLSTPDSPNTPSNSNSNDTESLPSNEPTPTQIFSLTLNPISSFSHTEHITSLSTNPLYHPFRPVSPQRSAIAAHLGKNLPLNIGMGRAGLCDWESGGVLGRRRLLVSEEEGEGDAVEGMGMFAAGENMNTPWRLMERDLELMKGKERGVMGGLKQFLKGREG